MSFKKLAEKIKKDTGWELVNFSRTYAGIHMLGSGAYSWTANVKGLRTEVCSSINAKELLARDKLEIAECVTLGSVIEIY
jgi:hypothetical protein